MNVALVSVALAEMYLYSSLTQEMCGGEVPKTLETFVKDTDAMLSPERPMCAFQGPPYHFCALTQTANEQPLPPYEDYCHVVPNLAKSIPVHKKKKKKKGDDALEDDEEGRLPRELVVVFVIDE